MRKSCSLIACLLLVLGLLAGCSDDEPAETTKPTEAETIETTAASEISEETTVPETTGITAEAELNTVVLLEGSRALRQDYVLLAVSQDGPFLAQDVKLNEKGADALAQWLMGEDSREITENFGVDAYGESVFLLPDEEICYSGKIAKSTKDSATIHLALDETLADTALLDDLIPVFEETYGYTVERTHSSAAAAVSAARNGYADLVLVKAGEQAQALADDGFTRTVDGFSDQQLPFVSMPYLLCGPREDPAGVGACVSATEAFAAIARSGCTFLSRGAGSDVHLLEQKFWAEGTDFGDWYISADMEMGPCLVMNDMEGGYILTDKLTWLIFTAANGII